MVAQVYLLPKHPRRPFRAEGPLGCDGLSSGPRSRPNARECPWKRLPLNVGVRSRSFNNCLPRLKEKTMLAREAVEGQREGHVHGRDPDRRLENVGVFIGPRITTTGVLPLISNTQVRALQDRLGAVGSQLTDGPEMPRRREIAICVIVSESENWIGIGIGIGVKFELVTSQKKTKRPVTQSNLMTVKKCDKNPLPKRKWSWSCPRQK